MDDKPIEGFKTDTGKTPWHLFPWDAAVAVCTVMQIALSKYPKRNWEKGMDYSRLWDAAIRHLTAWHNGENIDPETKQSHLSHAACCVLFLISYEIRNIGKDDRPTKP